MFLVFRCPVFESPLYVEILDQIIQQLILSKIYLVAIFFGDPFSGTALTTAAGVTAVAVKLLDLKVAFIHGCQAVCGLLLPRIFSTPLTNAGRSDRSKNHFLRAVKLNKKGIKKIQ